MEKRFLYVSLAFLLTGLIFVGCKKEPAEFLFSYSMESTDNYKIIVTFSSDKTYKIEEFNYFLDNQANKRDPKIIEGTLADDDYEMVRERILGAGLFNMNDAYGFDDKEERSELGDIIYQLSVTSGGEKKYISIASGSSQKFSSSFIRLIDFINNFLRTHNAK